MEDIKIRNALAVVPLDGLLLSQSITVCVIHACHCWTRNEHRVGTVGGSQALGGESTQKGPKNEERTVTTKVSSIPELRFCCSFFSTLASHCYGKTCLCPQVISSHEAISS